MVRIHRKEYHLRVWSYRRRSFDNGENRGALHGAARGVEFVIVNLPRQERCFHNPSFAKSHHLDRSIRRWIGKSFTSTPQVFQKRAMRRTFLLLACLIWFRVSSQWLKSWLVALSVPSKWYRNPHCSLGQSIRYMSGTSGGLSN